MRPEDVDPIVTEDTRVGRHKETHPAYAEIQANRVSSSHPLVLYGSDIGHPHFIEITISRSELHRDLSRDWPHATDEYISVMLSETQWAGFVSRMNSGGAQCTLSSLGGEQIPGITEPTRRTEQFKLEVSETLNDVKNSLDALEKTINSAKMTVAARSEMLGHIAIARNNLTPNLTFVAQQFVEHMENVTDHAKSEIHAYIENTKRLNGQPENITFLTEGKD